MSQTVENAVKNKIISQGRGWCFTPKHFLGIGSYASVRKALSELQKEKMIRRITQGLYDYPREHKTLGTIPPNIEAVARAIAEKNGAKIQPSGAYAANLIGISEQVPGRVIFLTDGPPKKLKIGKLEIIFKQATVKNMFAAGSKESLLVQALKFIGKDHIDQNTIQTVKKFLHGTNRREFEKNLQFAPQWIRQILFDIMKDDL
jgi:hypothetical protein